MTPRLFIIRHGETQWSLSGQHTSTTDIPLTAAGEKRIQATGRALVGPDRLIVPDRLAQVYVSPRARARRTLELLGLGVGDALPWQTATGNEDWDESVRCAAKVTVTEDVREWDYGQYEGLTSKVIREEKGAPGWDIWRDGCPGGESPEDVMQRLDRIIAEIRDKYHAPALACPPEECPPADVLIVAHGHILRALAARWVGRNVADNPSLILEAGGVGTLSYEHHAVDEPAILLGGAFVVPGEM
ncbi:phosphoglycerate mutase family protein [Trichodelitschia bisporula]|uniref:Phosphoglycerate mutase family protein n=1 Tax=Trichodelitschia bisporula TaxID=703511 RepID=A0A6G1I7L1_9PEZI|nr:phosphoglycerate mutase family protein [Trichodelitschia bisporula]